MDKLENENKLIIKNQEKILNKIEQIQKNQEELFEKYKLLLITQEKNTQNIYKIIQQLLLKDIIEAHRNEIGNFLLEKNIINNTTESLKIKSKKAEKNSDMILIKGGIYKPSFLNQEKEILDLYVSKYQVTQDKWKKYMKTNPSAFKEDKRPVENVTWIDALKFCNKISENFGFQPVYKIKNNRLVKIIYKTGEEVNPNLADFSMTEGYRLPTEVEWEWFAIGDIKNLAEYRKNLKKIAWYDYNSRNETHIVGTKKPNELGLYDVIGNVWEWCYDTASGIESENNISKRKIFTYNIKIEKARRVKGGSWHSKEWAYKKRGYRSDKKNDCGFRIVRTGNPQK